jgi:tetratricopeptide (TPR) repeat protein
MAWSRPNRNKNARDAHYARAHAGLADAYIILGNYAFRAPNEAYPHAKRAAMEALRLDDRLAEAHTALAGVSMWHDYDWAAAEREFQRAIALNPNSASAHHWYALLLSYLGRRIEAIEHIQRAERLDPLAPQIAIDRSWVLFLAREYDRAVEQAQKVRLTNRGSRTATAFLDLSTLPEDGARRGSFGCVGRSICLVVRPFPI